MKRATFALVGLCALLPLSAMAKIPVKRFAFLVGSNEGGSEQVLLRYASSDAQSVSRVLEQLGGISQEQRVVLLNPSRDTLLANLKKLSARIEQARAEAVRIELLFYYSGHSNESGLLLSNQLLTYSVLRAAIDRLLADVRIVVLDSCSSGAIIRMKGGKRVAPFLIDNSTTVKGHAFLTATSADEAAQESDRIGASYFTYAFLTGLRGAADANRDGRVTLHEAYQYSFNETLARTERTQAGPQHPAYDIQLVGTGDLVLTDLHGNSAGLVLGKEIDGQLYLRDGSGHLVAELRKIGGTLIELGLEPDQYRITLEAGGKVFVAKIDLSKVHKVTLNSTLFRMVSTEKVALRGTDSNPSMVYEKKNYQIVPFNLYITPALELFPTKKDLPMVSHIIGSLFMGQTTILQGLQFSSGANFAVERAKGAQLGMVNLVNGSLYGAQIGHLLNWAGNKSQGLQMAYINTVSGEFSGAQLGGVFNLLKDSSTGAQIGPVNLALADLQGTQIGVVNIGTKVPVQFGLINIAKDCDYPLGLINYVKNGYHAVSIWGSDATAANFGVKFGGRKFYTLLGVAKQLSPDQMWSPLAGLGLHWDSKKKWFLDIDAVYAAFFEGEKHIDSHLITLRAMAGWKIFKHFSIVGGPAFNVMHAEIEDDLDIAITPQSVKRNDDSVTRFYPGFALGIQIN